jgi:protein-S-isoprenylcysteine O-methyltransferase Ste14
MSDKNIIRADKPKLERSGIIDVAIAVVGTLLFGVILFVMAGRLNWLEAWILMILYTVDILIGGTWIIRNRPDLLNELGRAGEKAKPWDRVIVMILAIFFFSVFIVAGVDARFMWSSVPVGIKIVGVLVIILSFALIVWSYASNPYLSSYVRIQDERGQVTVTGGPYRYIRHPMYAGYIYLSFGHSLLLGSWWALIPAFLVYIAGNIRAGLEEKTLRAELAGYDEYSQSVRFRFIPGIW